MNRIDLNCDMGESYGAWKMGADADIMPLITSANIACGFHAGDPATIRKTVQLAVEHGVAVGAHPSLPDLQGFGRRTMKITPQEMYDLFVKSFGHPNRLLPGHGIGYQQDLLRVGFGLDLA